MAVSTAATTSSSRLTSAVQVVTSSPASLAVSSRPAGLRSTATTRAPSSTRRVVVERPIPLAAPVTSTECPESRASDIGGGRYPRRRGRDPGRADHIGRDSAVARGLLPEGELTVLCLPDGAHGG